MTDAALQSIAAAYGTPTFVFDADALQARVRAIIQPKSKTPPAEDKSPALQLQPTSKVRNAP